MSPFSDKFKEAARDYLWLLDKNYPQKKVLSLVGDRYRLLKSERSVLYRGIAATAEAREREKKLQKITAPGTNRLHIDMLNTLITIASYLGGKSVFICNDGWLRDASETHAGKIQRHLLEKATALLLRFILKQKPDKADAYIDSRAESGKEALAVLSDKQTYPLAIHSPESADHALREVNYGILATSDSQLIMHTSCSVIDLAKEVLTTHYAPDFNDLRNML